MPTWAPPALALQILLVQSSPLTPPQPTLISGKKSQDPRGAWSSLHKQQVSGSQGQPPPSQDLKEVLCSGELPGGSGCAK